MGPAGRKRPRRFTPDPEVEDDLAPKNGIQEQGRQLSSISSINSSSSNSLRKFCSYFFSSGIPTIRVRNVSLAGTADKFAGFSGREIAKAMLAMRSMAYGNNDCILTQETFDIVV